MTKKAKDKHCCQLFPWIQSISNHLWWSAQSCKGDAQVLVEKWKSIVHHVSNVHEWDSDPKALFPECDWLWENRSKSHIWYFKNYQFEIFNPQ